MKDSYKYGIVGFVLGLLAYWFVSSTILVNKYSPMMGAQTQTAVNSSGIDAHFIEQMIPHHEDAITMSELAKTKAKTNEVKTLAESIIVSQGKEIEQMRAWYEEWFERKLPTGSDVMQHHGMMSGSGMHMGVRGDETDIEELENADDFDIVFVQEMIPHHQMAVMMASMLKNGTKRPEMKELADNIITSQTKEIEQMRTWLKKWEAQGNSY